MGRPVEPAQPLDDHGEELAQRSSARGLHAWFVVLASFIVHVSVLGNQYTTGIFIVPYTREFNAGRGAVSIVGTIATVVFPLFGAVVGALSDAWGYRKVVAAGALLFCTGLGVSAAAREVWHLYLTQGLILGFGASALYFPAVSCVSGWFKRERRGLAVGLAVSGSGVGNFAYAPLSSFFIASYGWRATLLIVTAVHAGLLALAAPFIRRRLVPPRAPPGPDGLPPPRPPLFDFSLLRMRNFRLLYAATVTGQLGNLMPFAHISPFAQDRGLSPAFGALLVSVLGAGSAAGRIVLGLVADRWGPLPSLRLAMACSALAMLVWPWCTAAGSLAAFAAVYGFFGGGFISLLPVCSAELFGLGRLAAAIGLLFTSFGVANVVGSPLAGFIFDATGSYTAAIEAFAACMLLSLALLAFLRIDPRHPRVAPLDTVVLQPPPLPDQPDPAPAPPPPPTAPEPTPGGPAPGRGSPAAAAPPVSSDVAPAVS